MPINIAARRGAKNQRRKVVVAQKRKAEMEAGTLAGRVRLALANPIQFCRLSREPFESGLGTLIVARGATPHDLALTGFLLDTFALGVKDTYFRSITGHELANYLDSVSEVTPMEPVNPAYARGLLHSLVNWARRHGVSPHRDYPKLEPIFGSVIAASDVQFQFGFQGKPLLVGDMRDVGQVMDALEYDGTAEPEPLDQVTPAVTA